jgi:DNA-binding response OmpR family regulator
MKVLVVEDEAIILRLLTVYFTGKGHEVITATDGDEALEKFQAWTPDMVLLDIGLPRVSGWEVLETIRGRSRVPVILLTALDASEDIAKGFALGGNDYLRKPFQLHDLDARMQTILRRIEDEAASRAS